MIGHRSYEPSTVLIQRPPGLLQALLRLARQSRRQRPRRHLLQGRLATLRRQRRLRLRLRWRGIHVL